MLGAELEKVDAASAPPGKVAEQELRAQPVHRRVGHLGDDRLDQHLLTAGIELADDLGELTLDVGGPGDHDRIRAGEAGHHRRRAPALGGDGRLSGAAARRRADLRRRGQRDRAGAAVGAAARACRAEGRAVELGRGGLIRRLPDRAAAARAGAARRRHSPGITTLISVPLRAWVSSSRAIWVSLATADGSPRSATELEPSTATTDTPAPEPAVAPPCPPPDRPCSAAATSRALALRSAMTRVDAASVSTRRSTSRMRRTLSAKSAMTRLLPGPVGADRALCGHQRPHRVERRLRVDLPQAHDLGHEAVAVRPRRADPARLLRGVVQRLNPQRPVGGRHRDQPVGPQGRQEDLEIFRTRERPVGHHGHFARDRLSMMKVRPVTLAASAMKARMSASRTLSVVCASALVASSAARGATKSLFIGSAQS
jgi:hypothetical protein